MPSVTRFFQDVREEEVLPGFELEVTRTHIVKYAGASGDFFPIHHDEEFARGYGLPTIFAMGLMHGGMLSRVLTDWAGDGRVKRYKMRFSGMVWPGDRLRFQGRVKKTYRAGNENLVDCDLWVLNQNGEPAVQAEATVSLPDRT
ncbi:MAG: MaoC family dehydratase N-terminal domain-containing protein [Proteobacteria bacterium]|nr:MaoC family dehydratase N-terminal domain-containing protein [Pseudomonadota bacterium]